MEKPDLSHYSPTLRPLDALDRLEEKSLQTAHDRLDHTAWRKLDMSVLPMFVGLFLFIILEKGNIGFARVAGLQDSLGMSDYQFTMVLVATYVLGIAVQLPCNLLVKYVGANLMLPVMVTVGGIIAVSQGLAHNYSELLACRLLLGLSQGGIFPMVILCLSYFYPPKLLERRITVLYCVALLSWAFSGLLAGAIVQMDGIGGRPGWAWLFITEGLLAVIYGVISFLLLPASPEKVHSLTKTEREYIVSALAHASSVSQDGEKDKISWVEVLKAAKSPHVWFLAIVFLFSGIIEFGLAFFLPTIVAGLGYTGNQIQFMSTGPIAAAFVFMVVSVALSEYYHRRGCVVMVFALFKVIGLTMYFVSSSSVVGYVSLFFSVPGAFSGSPALTAWLTNNSAPLTRRASAVAINTILFELGGLFSFFLLGYLSTDPKHTIAMVTFIFLSIGIFILSAANWMYLQRQNRLKAERRQTMRKEDEKDGTGDRSAWFTYDL